MERNRQPLNLKSLNWKESKQTAKIKTKKSTNTGALFKLWKTRRTMRFLLNYARNRPKIKVLFLYNLDLSFISVVATCWGN